MAGQTRRAPFKAGASTTAKHQGRQVAITVWACRVCRMTGWFERADDLQSHQQSSEQVYNNHTGQNFTCFVDGEGMMFFESFEGISDPYCWIHNHTLYGWPDE